MLDNFHSTVAFNRVLQKFQAVFTKTVFNERGGIPFVNHWSNIQYVRRVKIWFFSKLVGGKVVGNFSLKYLSSSLMES